MSLWIGTEAVHACSTMFETCAVNRLALVHTLSNACYTTNYLQVFWPICSNQKAHRWCGRPADDSVADAYDCLGIGHAGAAQ